MHSKSNTEDIELPLLNKKGSQVPNNDFQPSPRRSKHDIETPHVPKYFEAGFLNRLIFHWATKIIEKGNETPFQQSMHYELRETEECGWLSNRFINEWEIAKHKTHPFLRTKWNTFSFLISMTQFLAFLNTIFSFSGPVLVSQIISYTENHDATLEQGLKLIVFFVVSRLAIIIIAAQSSQYGSQLQAKIVKGTRSLLFKKVLRFPLKRSQEYTTGSVLNNMLVDAESMSRLFMFLPQLIQLPIMLLMGIYMIYKAVGMAFISVTITIILVALAMAYFTNQTKIYQKDIMVKKDIRTKRITEILTGIKYIKMSGMENKFADIIGVDRENELEVWGKRYTIATLRMFLSWLTPTLLNLAVFGTYIAMGETLTAQKAFVVISTLMIVQGPIFGFSHLLSELLNSKVSYDRIQNFLSADDIDMSYINHKPTTTSQNALVIKNGTFSWLDENEKPAENAGSPTSPKKGDTSPEIKKKIEQNATPTKVKAEPVLIDINMTIPKGAFIGILGDVGSGKSSLFHALFGEMKIDKANPPSIEINGNVAYVSQKPWVLNDTVKGNILFDKEFDDAMYKEAIRGSCLEQDLKTLIKRDETEIGEKGVNLSGGQKARVALARAIYSDKDIYLLDDPLSAVDAHVGKYILEECLIGQLKSKTRILVTHKIETLKYMDYVYIFKAGRIVAQGDLETIKESSFYQEIEEKSNKSPQQPRDTEDSPPGKGRGGGAAGRGGRGGRGMGGMGRGGMMGMGMGMGMGDSGSLETQSLVKKQDVPGNLPKKSTVDEKEEQKHLYDKLMLNEDRNVGAVGLKTWMQFFNYFGNHGFFIFLLSIILTWITLKTASDFWLAYWTQEGPKDTEHGNNYYFTIYAILGIVCALLIYLRIRLVFFRSLVVNRRLHNEMFSKVIRAPINLFFDRVPLGRLVNRFTADLQIFDFQVPFSLGTLLYLPFSLTSRFLVCFFVGTAWAFPLIFIFFYVGIKVQQTYLNVYREVFRLSRITSSPVTSLFTESLDGLTHIRSSNYEDKLLMKYYKRQNDNMKNQILLAGLQGWFNFRINVASFLIVGPTIAAAILYSRGNVSNNGLIGLLITYLLDLNNNLIQCLQSFSSFESNLISFERCQAFTQIETEKSPTTRLPLANYSYTWPEHGVVEFQKYFTKYRPTLPYVLKDVSFKINASEKIGVVGRTGSGKSTLFLALLRIIEPHAGKVFIDGVDTTELGLDDLRGKITIIPQDPLLYKGTVRSNLDLLGEYSDQQIWTALEKVCMKNKFELNGLDSEIKEGGENLSAGEKQLLCIGRAILKKNKIILIDEATSSIDSVTEEAILESIKQNFKDCTVITIAHRLKTIIESDRVLFLANGEVQEFDTPKNLLENSESNFYKLWHEHEAAKS